MITEEKAIEALQNRLDALAKISESQKFNEWKTRTMQTLAHVYGEKHTSYLALKDIRSFQYSDRTANAKSEASELLVGLIEDLKNFGFPKINDDRSNGVNVLVNQHNTQNQSTNVSIKLDFLIEILKDELKGYQVKELKEVLKSNDEVDVKKMKFIDKIKSFGSDVASNILANLLTNPKVYEQLGGMM
jgi:hypothetical protein